jgi:hypothetical protein
LLLEVDWLMQARYYSVQANVGASIQQLLEWASIIHASVEEEEVVVVG